MSAYRLFWYPGTCSRIPLVALEEIGLPYERTLVDKLGGQDPEYLTVNPKGKVPALLDGDRVVTENPAIQSYLARRHPDAHLLPVGSLELETDVLTVISWFAAGVHPYITRLRFPRFFIDDPGGYDSIRAIARGQLEEAFSIIDTRLAGEEWLFSDWSLADVHLLWLWFRATGSGMDGRSFPNCIAHAQRCESRPSVARVLELEEREYARLGALGRVPEGIPPFQVGHAPTFTAAHSSGSS
jgi:glutathione S-transferase